MQETSLAIEQAAVSGHWAEHGILLAELAGRIYESIMALADIDPGTAEGTKSRIVAIGQEVFSELARADIQRDYSYDTQKILREGSTDATPNTDLLAQREKKNAERALQTAGGLDSVPGRTPKEN